MEDGRTTTNQELVPDWEAATVHPPVVPVVPSQAPPSTLRSVFVNRFGHLRACWRLSIYLAVVGILIVPSVIAMMVLLHGATIEQQTDAFVSPLQIMLYVFCNAVLILVGLAMLRWVDRRPAGMLGLDFRVGWLRELVLGLAAGIALVSVPALLLVAVGSIELVFSSQPLASLGALPPLLLFLTLAGTVEEVFFRGYLLQAFSEGSRRWIAAGTLSLLFALVHLVNPDVTLLGVMNIFLAGVFLAVAYYKTLRLWLPIGLHLSWNLAQSWLWGFDLSGAKLEHTLLVARPRGSDLLSGGEFGLEGSLVATALLILASIWLARTRTVMPTPEISALWASYPRGFGIAPQAASAGEPGSDPPEPESPLSPGSQAGSP